MVTRQVAFEVNHYALVVSVGDWLRVQPCDNGVFYRKGEEVIACWAVVTDEVPFHIILNGKVEGFVILLVHQVHIKERGGLPRKVVRNLLVVTGLIIEQLSGRRRAEHA